MIIWSDDHMTMWSYHHMIIWSYDHMIIWSHDHVIRSSYDHTIIWSYDHMIISSCDRAKIRNNFWSQGRKMKCWGSSETRFGKVSRRSEPSSRVKRPFKVSKKIEPENFKRPKNREDNSDFDDLLTKTIATTRSRFRKNLARCSRRKHRTTSRKRRKISRMRRGRWHGGAVKYYSKYLWIS